MSLEDTKVGKKTKVEQFNVKLRKTSQLGDFVSHTHEFQLYTLCQGHV